MISLTYLPHYFLEMTDEKINGTLTELRMDSDEKKKITEPDDIGRYVDI